MADGFFLCGVALRLANSTAEIDMRRARAFVAAVTAASATTEASPSPPSDETIVATERLVGLVSRAP